MKKIILTHIGIFDDDSTYPQYVSVYNDINTYLLQYDTKQIQIYKNKELFIIGIINNDISISLFEQSYQLHTRIQKKPYNKPKLVYNMYDRNGIVVIDDNNILVEKYGYFLHLFKIVT